MDRELGKSTVAAGLFYKLKKAGYNVELASEYAKELVYDNRQNILLKDQLYITAKQNRKIKRLIETDALDFIICDSPLLLGIIYNRYSAFPELIEFEQLVLKKFNTYNNMNVYLTRVHEYNPVGRYQSEEEASKIDKDILTMLNEFNIEYLTYILDNDIVDTLTHILLSVYMSKEN